MIITILSVAILVIGIGFGIFYKLTDRWYEWSAYTSVICTIIGAIFVLLCLGTIIDVQVNKDITYQNMVDRKNAIEYRLEQIDTNDQNVLINGGVYNDILDYNKDLRKIKKWAKNPWVNWFYVQEVTDLDYIEIDKGTK